MKLSFFRKNWVNRFSPKDIFNIYNIGYMYILMYDYRSNIRGNIGIDQNEKHFNLGNPLENTLARIYSFYEVLNGIDEESEEILYQTVYLDATIGIDLFGGEDMGDYAIGGVLKTKEDKIGFYCSEHQLGKYNTPPIYDGSLLSQEFYLLMQIHFGVYKDEECKKELEELFEKGEMYKYKIEFIKKGSENVGNKIEAEITKKLLFLDEEKRNLVNTLKEGKIELIERIEAKDEMISRIEKADLLGDKKTEYLINLIIESQGEVYYNNNKEEIEKNIAFYLKKICRFEGITNQKEGNDDAENRIEKNKEEKIYIEKIKEEFGKENDFVQEKWKDFYKIGNKFLDKKLGKMYYKLMQKDISGAFDGLEIEKIYDKNWSKEKQKQHIEEINREFGEKIIVEE